MLKLVVNQLILCYDYKTNIRKEGRHFKVAEKGRCLGVSILPDQGIDMAGPWLLGLEVKKAGIGMWYQRHFE
ncbi:hypothetical protein [Pedobacter frigoris]|uniref:hypothetical protein n=1 Tax=Pedobacter frigoris TaxID=2571272 RepID=UPI00197FAE09|nr:hypothetical protein [Pedobacter frigoris]